MLSKEVFRKALGAVVGTGHTEMKKGMDLAFKSSQFGRTTQCEESSDGRRKKTD
jgi:hypothetical protein